MRDQKAEPKFDGKTAAPVVKAKRRLRLQFSLRGLALLTFLAAILFGYLARPSIQYLHDRKVASRIEQLGGNCVLVEMSPSWGLTVDDYLTRIQVMPRIDQLYRRVVAISLSGSSITLDDARAIAKCRELKQLQLANVDLTNEAVTVLAQAKKLRTLDIHDNPSVTDAGMQSSTLR